MGLLARAAVGIGMIGLGSGVLALGSRCLGVGALGASGLLSIAGIPMKFASLVSASDWCAVLSR